MVAPSMETLTESSFITTRLPLPRPLTRLKLTPVGGLTLPTRLPLPRLPLTNGACSMATRSARSLPAGSTKPSTPSPPISAARSHSRRYRPRTPTAPPPTTSGASASKCRSQRLASSTCTTRRYSMNLPSTLRRMGTEHSCFQRRPRRRFGRPRRALYTPIDPPPSHLPHPTLYTTLYPTLPPPYTPP